MEGIVSLIVYSSLVLLNLTLLVTLTQYNYLNEYFIEQDRDIVSVVVEVLSYILSTITTLGNSEMTPESSTNYLTTTFLLLLGIITYGLVIK